MKHQRPHAGVQRRRGFTLLELLLVLAILVVLGGIVLMNFGGAQDDAYQNSTLTQLNSLKANIAMYRMRMHSLPDKLEDLRDGPSDSEKKARWTSPIINEIPTDAWGQPIEYTVSGNTFELKSNGIDGQPGTEDDLVVKGP